MISFSLSEGGVWERPLALQLSIASAAEFLQGKGGKWNASFKKYTATNKISD